jgi:Xaa-Pro aminopeptidase
MMSKYPEDCSPKARREEVDIKVKRIQALLESEGLNALYLTKQPNFSWITAGGNGCVTICVEASVASVLITKDGGRFVLTNIIEYTRMLEEEQLGEIGFEVISQEWYENKNAEIIKGIVGDLSKVGSDICFENCRMIQGKILPLHYSLTYGEICRYQYLGDTMSEALEAYLATLKPGMNEYEITGGIANALWPHKIDQVLFMTQADERAYKYRHGVPFGKKVEKLLSVSCNGRYKGLITTTTRMVCFGDPGQDYLKQFDTTCEIHARQIAATKPGVDDIVPHRIGKAAYEEFGCGEMYFKHAQGGPQSYYNRYYSISESVHGIVQENQCYCYQPVIDGSKVEDGVIATPEGPLMVTKPKSFPKVVKKVGDVTIESPGVLVIE